MFYSCLMTETNTFSALATTYASFEAEGMLFGDDVFYTSDGQLRPAAKTLFDAALANDCQLVGGMLASAAPGAAILHADYLRLRDHILNRLRSAVPVDFVFLHLHGAMVSSECFDCEGDLLDEIRSVVGDHVPIGVVLDPHAHLTEKMVTNADIMAFMKEYPHIDGDVCTAQVLSVLFAIGANECRPQAAVSDCNLLGFFPTDKEPMRQFVDLMLQTQESDSVLSVSLIHGFPWGDTPDTGAKMLVYANDDAALAQTIADEFRDRLLLIKDDTVPEMITIDASIDMMRNPADYQRPIVFSDIADNPGGGAPSDSTFILEAALNAGVRKMAIGLMVDPKAVDQCHRAGVGSTLKINLGGKAGSISGRSLNLHVSVMALANQAMMTVIPGVEFPMGDTAWVRIDGIDVVMASHREQMYAPSGFTHLGIDLAQYDSVVVKSSNHFRAFFAEYAGEIHTVNTPGALGFDFARLPYKHCTASIIAQ